VRLEEVDRYFDFFSVTVSRSKQDGIVARHLAMNVRRVNELGACRLQSRKMEEREEKREQSGEAKLKEGRGGMKRAREGDLVIPRHA
jgi:hypothetical protein